ncbi:MAG: ketosteroid isomerase family protein [Saprospiraceae bacterium]
MKKLLLFAALIIYSGIVHSQTVNDEFELKEFTHNFMASYNKHNVAELKEMYSEYAVRIDQGKNKITGADNIIAFFQQRFFQDNTTLYLKYSSLSWSDAEHAFIAHGTYEMVGKTNVYDIEINTKGTYANTMIKDKGKWKIGKSVLLPIVKVIVTQQVKDVAKFKSNFKKDLSMRMSAGEVSEEISAVQDQPNMVCIISEWTSVKDFQDFYANPDLKKRMKEAGVIGEPNILILGGQK